MISKKVVFGCPLGMQVKPAGEICKTAAGFACSCTLTYEGGSANAKSMLSVLGSGLRPGQEIEICCNGEDEEKALEAMIALIEQQKDLFH